MPINIKYQFLFLFILSGFPAISQEAKNNDSVYTESLLLKLRSKTISAGERKELKDIAVDLQNRGQILDESKHDYNGSLILIDKAIILFNELEETLFSANNKKFKGYLLGRLNRFEEGKIEIHEAIGLFSSRQADWGVAVSQFDLARLYDLENKRDSAVFYCNAASAYWKEKANKERVFLCKNLLIHILTEEHKLTEAGTVQQELQKMIDDNDFHWQGLIDYYIVSEKLYRAANLPIIAAQYHELYTKKITQLKKDGITALSYFEL